jgi:hypothetical protein
MEMAVAITLVIVAFVGIPCCCMCHAQNAFLRKHQRIKSEISAEAYRDFTQNKASTVLKAELRRLFLSGNNAMEDYLKMCRAIHSTPIFHSVYFRGRKRFFKGN